MKLFVLRHGEAQPVATSDADRELTEFGESQVNMAADFFSKQNLEIDRIICSPYRRAKQTAVLFKDAAALTCEITENSNITPDIPISRAIKSVDQNFNGNLLMVSHQPLVSSLITYLVWGETTPRVGMDTASLACLELEFVQANMAELDWIQHAHHNG